MRANVRVSLRLLPVGLALVALGCQSTLESGLDEEQADSILVALDGAGIGARKEPEEGSSPPRFRVVVPSGDVPGALAELRALDLPRRPQPGFAALFEGGGLVPTATEERARHAAALSGELSRSLETMHGVAGARVHVGLPDPTGRLLDAASRERPRASVLIRTRSGARIDEASVKALVAGAIPEMRAEDVSVVQTPAPAPARAEARLVMVGPIGVSRGSAAALKAILAAALGLNVVLVLALLWRARFASRKTTKTAAARDGAAEE